MDHLMTTRRLVIGSTAIGVLRTTRVQYVGGPASNESYDHPMYYMDPSSTRGHPPPLGRPGQDTH